MTDEYSRAISFANNYFALVDGLAYGLEEHLAEDVSLNWFGKTVNGKRNVAAFMRINMTNSRHMFDDIAPASAILTKKRTARRKHKSKGMPIERASERITSADALIKNGLDFEKLRIEDTNDAKDEKIELIDPTSIVRPTAELIATENIVENSVKPENVKGKPLTLSNLGMECVANGLSADPAQCMKFVKANGLVHIHRSSGPNKIRKWQSSAFVSGLPGQTCRRHCKLQIAYTRLDDQTTKCKERVARSRIANGSKEKSLESSKSCERRETNDSKVTTSKGRKRLNSQEDEEMHEALCVETEAFNPFEDFDSYEDRRRFLDCFDAEMAPNFNFTSPKYVDNRLIFDWTRRNGIIARNRANFKFDYTIHALSYESNATSSLTEEFEDRRSLSDTEKSV